jgi:hypothetical protein
MNEPTIDYQRRARRLRIEHRDIAALVHALNTGEADVFRPRQATAQLLRLMALYRQELAWLKANHLI